MAYCHIMGFMYEAGRAVGEFSDEDPDALPVTLPEIVHRYVQEYYWLDIFLLRRQLKRYLRRFSVGEFVDYYDPPFNQELMFVEYRFDCGLFEFLTALGTHLDKEIRLKRNCLSDVIVGSIFGLFVRQRES